VGLVNAQAVSRWRVIVAAVVIALLAVVAVVAFWPRDGVTPALLSQHEGHTASGSPTSPVTPTPLATSTTAPIDVSDDVVETPVGGGEETSLASAASAPTIVGRDDSSLGAPNAPVDPSTVLGSGVFGGCTVEYGTNGQCLPVYPPSIAGHIQDMVDAGLDPSTMPHNWTCDEVRQYFPSGIAVRQPGVDPQALDDDGDAMACEPATEEDLDSEN